MVLVGLLCNLNKTTNAVIQLRAVILKINLLRESQTSLTINICKNHSKHIELLFQRSSKLPHKVLQKVSADKLTSQLL